MRTTSSARWLLICCTLLLINYVFAGNVQYRDELLTGQNIIGDNVPAVISVLNFPTGIALSSNVNTSNTKPFKMVIADSLNQKIRIIDNDGIISSLPVSVSPIRVFLDVNMNIYFSDMARHIVQKYSPTTKQTTIVAGTGQSGNSGNGLNATLAQLTSPIDVVVNKKGEVYISDFDNNVVRVVKTDGIIENYVGSNSTNEIYPPRLTVKLGKPSGLSFNLDETELYIADSAHNCILKVLQDGSVITVAGNRTAGYSGDGGLAVDATISSPMCVFVNYKNELVICDTGNHRIRLVSTSGIISTIAGGGSVRGDNGPAVLASLFNPYYAIMNSNDELFIADSSNNAIRKVSEGKISTIVGSPTGSTDFFGDNVKASLSSPFQIYDINFNQKTREIIFKDSKSIRKITPDGTVKMLSASYTGHSAVKEGAKLKDTIVLSDTLIAAYGDDFYLQTNSKIFKVDLNDTLEIVAGDSFNSNGGLAIYPNGDILVSDHVHHVIRKYSPQTQLLSVVAGNFQKGFTSDNILATAGSINVPYGIAISKDNEIYFADSKNFIIRKILTNGTIVTVAGDRQNRYGGENATYQSSINAPLGVGLLSNGSLVFTEGGRVRILHNNSLFTLASGFSASVSLSVDENDVIYTADCSQQQIKTITIGNTVNVTNLQIPDLFCPTKAIAINQTVYFADSPFVKKYENGIVTIIAGTLDYPPKRADPGILSTLSSLNSPCDIAKTQDGNLLILENDVLFVHNIKDGTRNSILGYGEQVISRSDELAYYESFLEVSNDKRLLYGFWGESTVRTSVGGKSFSLIGNKNYVDVRSDTQLANETLLFHCFGAGFAPGNNQVYVLDSGNYCIRKIRDDGYAETIYKFTYAGQPRDFSVMSNGDIIVYLGSGVDQIIRISPKGTKYVIANVGSTSKIVVDYVTNKVYYIVNNEIRSLTPYCENGNDFNEDQTECVPVCFGIKANSTNVCSGRGSCKLPDSCECSQSGWVGSNCNVTFCFGFSSDNSSVCSGNGKCNSLNNCSCSDGYHGETCALFDCYGNQVCANNGTCDGPARCSCRPGYGGLRCEYHMCYGKTSEKSDVCNGKGTCTFIDTCDCQQGWFGFNCNITSCFGINSTNSSVCTSRGKCTGKDACSCDSGYGGPQCQYSICNGKYENETDVCSHNGICTQPNTCICKEGFTGHNCEHFIFKLDHQSISLIPLVSDITKKENNYFNGRCDSIFDAYSLEKIGEQPICVWNTNFTVYLGYNFNLETGDILKGKKSNITIFVNIEEAKHYSKNYAQGSSRMLKLYSTLPYSTDLIVKPNLDFNFRFYKSIDFKWYCSSCASTSGFYGTNKDILIIPKSYLTTTSTISLVLNTNNWANNSKSSSKLDLKFTSTGPNIEVSNDIQEGRIISCNGYECVLEIETYGPSQSLSLYGSIFTNVLKNKYMARVFSDTSMDEYDGSLLISAKDATLSRDATVTLQYRPYSSNIVELSLRGVDTKYTKKDTIHISVEAEKESSFRLSKMLFNWNLVKIDQSSTVTIPKSGYTTKFNVAIISAGSLEPGIYRFEVSTNDDILGIGSVSGGFEVISNNTLSAPVVRITNSWNSLSSGCYIEAEIRGNYSEYLWTLQRGRIYANYTLTSQVLEESENYLKTGIRVSGEVLFQEEDYVFQIEAIGENNTAVSTLYSFTTGRAPRIYCDIGLLSSNYLTISCDYHPESPIMMLVEFNVNMQRKFIISNTLKKKLVTNVPVLPLNSSISVKMVTVDGNLGQFDRNLTIIPSVSLNPVSFFINEYSNIKGNKTTSFEMLLELNFLLTYLETLDNQITTYGNLDSLKATLLDIISVLSDIRNVGFNVDDKLISLMIPPVHKTFKFLYMVDKTISGKVDTLKEWISWSIDSFKKYIPYYNVQTIPFLIDSNHLAEIGELIAIGQSQNYISFEKLRTSVQIIEILLSKSVPQTLMEETNGESIVKRQILSSISQVNSKQIRVSDVSIKFPLTFSNDLQQVNKRSCLVLISTSKKTDTTIVSNIISLSIQQIDDLELVSVSKLNQTVDIIFENVATQSTNLSCNYFDFDSGKWSTSGVKTTVKIKSTQIVEVQCSTSHFSTFSVIDNTIIAPIPIPTTLTPVSSSNNQTQGNLNRNTNTDPAGVIAGILVPLLLIILIIFTVVIIIIVVLVIRKKKKQENPQENQHRETVELEEQPFTVSDFPSQESAHFTPLMSFSSVKSSDSQNSFNPLSRYKDLVKIGEGAFGSIYKAYDLKNDYTKALKIIKYSSAEELNSMMKEGSQLMNIEHEHIIKVNDFFVDNSQILCIDMDFYSNGDLSTLINSNEFISERKIKQIIYQVCDALDFVHTKLKVIHRDVKPTNIFIKDNSSENIHVVLADFGLAKSSAGSVNKSYAGTPLFMSLELALGGKYGFNTDIYSLGVAIYQLITKDTSSAISHLFISNKEEDVVGKLRQDMEKSGFYSSRLIDICLNMLEKEASKRPSAKTIMSNPFFKD